MDQLPSSSYQHRIRETESASITSVSSIIPSSPLPPSQTPTKKRKKDSHRPAALGMIGLSSMREDGRMSTSFFGSDKSDRVLDYGNYENLGSDGKVGKRSKSETGSSKKKKREAPGWVTTTPIMARST